MIRIVHYLNQFFGKIGAEAKAGVPPSMVKGPIGPGTLIDSLVKGKGKVVATAICGDNYFLECKEEAVKVLSPAPHLTPVAMALHVVKSVKRLKTS